MKYYVIAGEASGDLHGSNLLRELKKLDTAAVFRCWGGELMEEQGAEVVKHYRDLAFMGFKEVLANISTILSNLEFCKKDIVQWQPDVLILVDYPGFNLRIAEFAKKAGFRVVYYISPQVWAWKASRVKLIRQVVDRLMVILPFEKDFYRQHQYEVEYVGHPLLDAIDRFQPDPEFLKQNGLEGKKLITVMPGSRKQELQKMLPLMLRMKKEFPDFHFVIAGAPGLAPSFYQQFLQDYQDVKILWGQTYNLLYYSYAALVKSGTSTLETALFRVPEVVCYRTSGISYAIGKRLVKVKFISLVNLIMDRLVVKELIQDEMNEHLLKVELEKIIYHEENRNRILRDYDELRQRLGNAGASAHAARVVTDFLQSSSLHS